MNDPVPIIDPAIVWAQIETQHQARAALSRDALRLNKASLFDALEAAGVNVVFVAFDGSGDSGQIEHITARMGDDPIELPTIDIMVAVPHWDGSGLDHQTLSVPAAIETLAYDFLEETHGGWENNAGAYGDFTFDVSARSIQLDYNERFEDSEYSSHSW